MAVFNEYCNSTNQFTSWLTVYYLIRKSFSIASHNLSQTSAPACLRASVAVPGWPMPGDRARRDAPGKNEEGGAADAKQQPQVSTPSNPALCMLCLATPVRGDTPPFIHHQRPPPAPHASTTCPRIARMPATVNRPSTSRPSPYFKTIRRAFEAYQARASGGSARWRSSTRRRRLTGRSRSARRSRSMHRE